MVKGKREEIRKRNTVVSLRIELDEASLKVPSCPLHLCAQNNVSQHLLTFAVAATDMIICTLPQKQSVIFGTANKSIVEL